MTSRAAWLARYDAGDLTGSERQIEMNPTAAGCTYPQVAGSPVQRSDTGVYMAPSGYDPTWMDPTASWQAKLSRAGSHLESLARQVEEFRQSQPYSVTPGPTEKPGRLAHRLRYLKPVPVEISTTIGDVLHNQRSALENLAFELAKSSRGGDNGRRKATATIECTNSGSVISPIGTAGGRLPPTSPGRAARTTTPPARPCADTDAAESQGNTQLA